MPNGEAPAAPATVSVPRRPRPNRPLATQLRLRFAASSGQAFLVLLITGFAAMVVAEFASKGVAQAGAQVVNGLQIGAIYALIAVGYTMVYGIIELINFAHGDVFTFGGMLSVWIGAGFGALGLDLTKLATSNVGGLIAALAIIFPLTMLCTGTLGVVIERVAYRRLRNAPRLAPLITAIGMSFLLQGIMFVAAGSGNYPARKDDWITGRAFTIGSVNVSWPQLFVIVIAVAMMLGLQMFVRYTRVGKAMRATAQDRDAALLSGININRTISLTFFIGSAMAAVGGIVYAIYFNLLQWNLGFKFGIIAFTAAVLGGIGNILGAGVGGFLIGLIYAFGSDLAGGEWGNSIIFAMLILVLTLRPNGLLGMRVPDRA
ncbi:MAG TPA: branched-chain amino acid ABC transporter permease [Candidatus Dormibacteraeota bacterium]|nr:branched-chain amino acid ABC transporter permease [Candidatus Dormibacteraeota bacterium]